MKIRQIDACESVVDSSIAVRFIKYKTVRGMSILFHRLTEIIASAPKGELLKRVLNPLLRE